MSASAEQAVRRWSARLLATINVVPRITARHTTRDQRSADRQSCVADIQLIRFGGCVSSPSREVRRWQ
jgi:hypothetical protein